MEGYLFHLEEFDSTDYLNGLGFNQSKHKPKNVTCMGSYATFKELENTALKPAFVSANRKFIRNNDVDKIIFVEVRKAFELCNFGKPACEHSKGILLQFRTAKNFSKAVNLQNILHGQSGLHISKALPI